MKNIIKYLVHRKRKELTAVADRRSSKNSFIVELIPFIGNIVLDNDLRGVPLFVVSVELIPLKETRQSIPGKVAPTENFDKTALSTSRTSL